MSEGRTIPVMTEVEGVRAACDEAAALARTMGAECAEVIIPSRDAYPMTDKIERKVESLINDESLVILCAGAVGTILADRLAAKGVHAIDLGFIGKFL